MCSMFFFFQAEDGIRDGHVTGVQTCALPISKWDKDSGTVDIDPSNVESANRIDIDAHAGSSRIPILMCCPLLHRLCEAFIPDLGGCHIGDRPIDFHLSLLRESCATVDKRESGVWIQAPARGLR